MNLATLILGLLVLLLGGAGFFQGIAPMYAGAVCALALGVMASSLLKRDPAAVRGAGEDAGEGPEAPPAPAQREAPLGEEAIMLLNRLQEKGRFLDFLMDDVSAYDDGQVGAAARVVHQGCRKVIDEAFAPCPVSEQAEGQEVTLSVDYPRHAYQLSGTVKGEPPFTGNLVHKGWRAEKINLPQRVEGSGDALHVIVPATVEIKS